jgi:hypothetical protein
MEQKKDYNDRLDENEKNLKEYLMKQNENLKKQGDLLKEYEDESKVFLQRKNNDDFNVHTKSYHEKVSLMKYDNLIILKRKKFLLFRLIFVFLIVTTSFFLIFNKIFF